MELGNIISDNIENSNHDTITSNAIRSGIEIEVDRALPYWRCYEELKNKYRHTPVLLRRHTTLVSRLPCYNFTNVDVVWAENKFTLRVQTSKMKREQLVRSNQKIDKCSDDNFWTSVPFVDHEYTLGTMHFVHHNAHHMYSHGWNCSFHIQSVIRLDRPEILQCVAGQMIHVGLLLHLAWRNSLKEEREHKRVQHNNKTMLAREHKRKRNGKIIHLKEHEMMEVIQIDPLSVLILGMGGNSMALALRFALGATAQITVIEKEFAVLQTCQRAQTFNCSVDLCSKQVPPIVIPTFNEGLNAKEETSKTCTEGSSNGKKETSWSERTFVDCVNNIKVVVAEAMEWLTSFQSCHTKHYDLIFTDLFEPADGKMNINTELLQAALKCLHDRTGLLVVNTHELPTAHSLRPFTNLVGSGQVHAINVRGWKESIIVINRSEHQEVEEVYSNASCKSDFCASIINNNYSKGNTSACEHISVHKEKVNQQDSYPLEFSHIAMRKIREAEQFYLNTLPGWLPQGSWFRSSRRVNMSERQWCRLWEL